MILISEFEHNFVHKEATVEMNVNEGWGHSGAIKEVDGVRLKKKKLVSILPHVRVHCPVGKLTHSLAYAAALMVLKRAA